MKKLQLVLPLLASLLAHSAYAEHVTNPCVVSLNQHVYDNVGDDGAVAIADNKQLQMLGLNNANITAVGAKAIATMPVLESLDLNNYPSVVTQFQNHIGDEGAAAIVDNHALAFVELDNNNIGDAGAVALSKNKAIDWLTLNDNQITDEGAFALAKMKNTHYLSIAHNKINEAGLAALDRNVYIDYLNTKGNPGSAMPAVKRAQPYFKNNMHCLQMHFCKS